MPVGCSRTSLLARLTAAFVVLGIVALCLGPLAKSALAHERRTVGPYTFVVGFFNEPAFVENTNGVDLRITRTASSEPVEGAERTLKVEMGFGGQRRTLDLRGVFGQPGRYTADLIPTRSGTYTFRFFGTLEGQIVDETFTSGPGRFNDVQSREEFQFPERLPALGSVSRTANEAQVAAESGRTAARDARSAVSAARALAIVGIVVGALGLATGAGALMLSRRR